MEAELDMEDIESRLYSQVHHSNTEDEQRSDLIVPARIPLQSVNSNPYSLSNVPKPTTHRYFHKEHVGQSLQPTYISFDDINPPQNNIPVSPKSTDLTEISTKSSDPTTINNISISPSSTDITTEGNFTNQFQNNITVNQYTLPMIISPELNEVLSPTFTSKYFTSWAVQNQNLVGKNKKRPKKERKNVKKQNKKESRLAYRQFAEVICVSDDSDDECIIQDVHLATPQELRNISTGFPKKYNEDDETRRKPESDDDIIYIPPPPIEVVNVDGDDKEQEVEESAPNTSNSSNGADELSPTKPKSVQKESSTPESAANDFLDSTAIENNTHKFNFSLHGSDFNNAQGEFVRPANPVDFCETESSCSTNELNRDFHNSVKTVVFDEVEFPREDIFSGNNLEKFGTYITPKRNKNKKLDNMAVTGSSANTEVREVVVEVVSSTDSSSESDYEPSKYLKKNLKSAKKLPTLSPMQPVRAITELTKRKKTLRKKLTDSSKAKELPTPKRVLIKKKSVVDSSDTDSDTGKDSPKSKSKKLSKKKKKKSAISTPLESCSEIFIESDSQRKRKKKCRLPNTEDGGLEKSQNKKKKGSSETHNSESGENTDEYAQKKKRRKSVHSELHESEKNVLADVLAQKTAVDLIGLDDLGQLQSMKKKNSSESNNAQNEETPDLDTSSSQKKKKKNSLEPKTAQTDNVESTLSAHQAEETIRNEFSDRPRSRKKKVSSGSNSGNEENINATRNKKRNRSRSGSPKIDDALDSEAIVQKNKDQHLESLLIPEHESTNQETAIEKPKKKKRKSEIENPSTNDTVADKKQKTKKMSFSEILEQKTVDIEDRVRSEGQKKKKMTSLPPDAPVLEHGTENTHSLSDNMSAEVDSTSQEKEVRAEGNSQQPLVQIISGHKDDETPTPLNPTGQVESSGMGGAEESDSDEELIVVDDIDPDSSALIVVDEVESTMSDEVVVSSDSESDFQEFDNVGKDMKLANCVGPADVSDDSDELIVVDDDSSGNFKDNALDEDYSNFDVDAIQSTQTDDPEAWKVSYNDRCVVINRKRGPRCNRCRQFGHIGVRCTEKTYPPNCTLCGNPGHQEPRCPNKICRQCGNEGDYSTSYCWKCFKFRNSICKLCNMKGHIAKTCPDLWRRYHLTTKEGPLVVSLQPQLKPKDQQWCSGCAQRGHMEHECNYFREYPPIKPSIVSYEDVLQQEKSDRSYAGCSRNILITVTQNLPKDPNSDSLSCSREITCARCTPIKETSSQSQIPILPDAVMAKVDSLLDKEQSQQVSSSKVSSEKSSSQSIPSTRVAPPSESQNRPSLPSDSTRPQTVTDAKPLESSTPVQVHSLNRSVDDKYKSLVSDVNKCLNFTERDYDDLILVANAGLLGHIRSIQFGAFKNHNLEDQIKPLRANMIEQSTGFLIREDQHRIRCLIMYDPISVVKEFLRKEMSELRCWVSKRDPRFLIRQYFKYNKLSLLREPLTTQIVSDKCFWFRILNMFLFGVHEFDKGKQSMRVLEKFLMGQTQNNLNRTSLVQAHKHIFGVDKHGGVDYPRLIQQIIDNS